MTGSLLTRYLSFTECPRPSSKTSGNGPTIPILVFSGLIILAQLVVMIVLVLKLADEHDRVTTASSNLFNATTEASNAATPDAHLKESDIKHPESQLTVQMPPIIINGYEHTVNQYVIPTFKPREGTNVCAGKKPDNLPNVPCILHAMVNVGPQSGSDVTEGYQGLLDVDHDPLLTPFFENGMCPINVHFHLGSEHRSAGQYDEDGRGPIHENGGEHNDPQDGTNTNENGHRRRLSGDVRPGFRCHLYNAADPKFTTPYLWQHCQNMEVGETYEVHWPHSAAGACGTPNQYQTPFYDGVFCRDNILSVDTLAAQIGVQAQVFTIVNDESYYYPDLFRGMIVDSDNGYGQDVAKYTGSTTGTSRDNEVCSQYSPITWHVDRRCQLISASSFDKMCADMKAQRDDMTEDLMPHGARELVNDELAANNHHRSLLRKVAT